MRICLEESLEECCRRIDCAVLKTSWRIKRQMLECIVAEDGLVSCGLWFQMTNAVAQWCVGDKRLCLGDGRLQFRRSLVRTKRRVTVHERFTLDF